MNKFSLKEYIELLENEGLLVKTEGCEDVLEREVNLLSYNSKEVKENTLFVVILNGLCNRHIWCIIRN